MASNELNPPETDTAVVDAIAVKIISEFLGTIKNGLIGKSKSDFDVVPTDLLNIVLKTPPFSLTLSLMSTPADVFLSIVAYT
jgi:hypothetical protein